MNHYELLFIVNPQLSKDSNLFDKCKKQISSINGILHRAEDIGLRDLAYQINDCSKGHYFLLNFECLPNNLREIESLFKFDETILRSSIVKKRRAETETSALMAQTKNSQVTVEKTLNEDTKTDGKAEINSEEIIENTELSDVEEDK